MTSGYPVKITLMPHAQGLPFPRYASDDAAGLDLVAANPVDEPVTLEPGRHALIPTGLVLEIPKGFEAQVRPRSGLALRFGVTVLNSPGTIDADYRGEIGIVLVNFGNKPFSVNRGERVAQLVFARVERVELVAASELSSTGRGAKGFGSTGWSNEGVR